MKIGKMKIRPSVWMALFLTLAIGLWLWSGALTQGDATSARSPETDATVATSATDGVNQRERVSVRYIESRIQRHHAVLQLTGSTDFARQVTVRAETQGRVVALDMEETRRVKSGSVIVRLAEKDRPARYEQAKAVLKQAKLQFEAARKLADRGFQSEIRRAEAEAGLRSAETALRSAELELENITIKTPITGRVQQQLVEVGDYVQTGTPLAVIVETNPIHIVVQVSEKNIGELAVGEVGEATTVSGETLPVSVRRIAPLSEARTRTYEVVLEAENPGDRIPAGMTTEVSLSLQETGAHLISPALLTLNDAGEIGVKTVNKENRVDFYPVRIVETSNRGSWVSGLPETARIISVGQEFVTEGQIVAAVPDESAS